MPDVPLNLPPRHAVPLGEVRGNAVYISDLWHRLVFEIIRRVGGSANSVVTDITNLAVTDGNFIVGDGSSFVTESGNTARTSLGLGTGDSPQFTAVNIGDAADTTITRASAGVIAVEGVNVALNSTTSTHTAQQIELGHASDTTLSRASAGVLLLEGETVPTVSRAQTWTLAQTFAVPPVIPSYTVAGVPSASPAAQVAYISNESGGAVLAFSDGTNWRRVTDRAVIS